MEERDLAAVASLCAQLGYPVDAATLAARFATVHGLASHALYVAVAEGEVLAWMLLSVAASLTDGPSVEIGGLVVDEQARGRGLGRRLVRFAETWARERGIGRVRVRSQVKREEAHAFYRGLGYAHQKTSHVFAKTF